MLERSIFQFAVCSTLICVSSFVWNDQDSLAPGLNMTLASALAKLSNFEALLPGLESSTVPPESAKLGLSPMPVTRTAHNIALAHADIGVAVLTVDSAVSASGAIGSASASVLARPQ